MLHNHGGQVRYELDSSVRRLQAQSNAAAKLRLLASAHKAAEGPNAA